MIAEVVLSSSIALAESLPSSTDDISVQDPDIHKIFQDISLHCQVPVVDHFLQTVGQESGTSPEVEVTLLAPEVEVFFSQRFHPLADVLYPV